MRICIIVVFAALYLAACKKSVNSELEKPFEINGGVLLVDEGNVFVEQSGMRVSVENANPAISSITDANGDYRLTIPTNMTTFTLVYEKPLYGTLRSYYKVCNDTLYELFGAFAAKWLPICTEKNCSIGESLGLKSTVTVNSLQAIVDSGKLKITCNVSTPNTAGDKFIRFFYATGLPNINFQTVPKTAKNMSTTYKVNNGDNTFDICMSCLYDCAGLKSGETVYITAYGDSRYNNWYAEPSGNLVMPNVNLSNHPTPVAFTLP